LDRAQVMSSHHPQATMEMTAFDFVVAFALAAVAAEVC
jgi:hypothetical protein